MMRTRSTNESGGHSAYVGDFFSTVPKSMYCYFPSSVYIRNSRWLNSGSRLPLAPVGRRLDRHYCQVHSSPTFVSRLQTSSCSLCFIRFSLLTAHCPLMPWRIGQSGSPKAVVTHAGESLRCFVVVLLVAICHKTLSC